MTEEKKTQKQRLPEATFGQLVYLLGTQAMQQLGMIPNLITKKKEMDLTVAKFSIDLLNILQKKTHGNLLPDEQKMLDDLLFDLRLNYVNAVKEQETKSS